MSIIRSLIIAQSLREHTLSKNQTVIEVCAPTSTAAPPEQQTRYGDSCDTSSAAVPDGVEEVTSVQVLKQFPFSSALQHMSVLVRDACAQYAFVKGLPEIIESRCRPDSSMRLC